MELFKKYKVAIIAGAVVVVAAVAGVIGFNVYKAANTQEALGMTYASSEVQYTTHTSDFGAETTQTEPAVALLHFSTDKGDDAAQWTFGDVSDVEGLTIGAKSVDESSTMFDGNYDTQLCIIANKAGTYTFKAYGATTSTITVTASADADGNVTINNITRAVDVKE